ncbi:MAG: hypothetical protein R6U84_01825, partial [Candidatus Cloacimonadales bacterium]
MSSRGVEKGKRSKKKVKEHRIKRSAYAKSSKQIIATVDKKEIRLRPILGSSARQERKKWKAVVILSWAVRLVRPLAHWADLLNVGKEKNLSTNPRNPKKKEKRKKKKMEVGSNFE